jgi:hypothetical protein
MSLIGKFSKYLPDVLDENLCWEWKGPVNLKRGGYGQFHFNKKTLKAHRVSYEIHYAEPLGSFHCLHKCDNPKCVNPLHLFSGTNLDNVRDKVNKGRCYTGNQKGEYNGASKLTDDIVKNIRKLYNTGCYTTTKLAEMYNVHRSTISYIVNNKTFKHLLEG